MNNRNSDSYLVSMLKIRMKQRSMTQKELAERSGITENHLSRILTGKSSPTLYVFCRVAQALNISVELKDNYNIWEA